MGRGNRHSLKVKGNKPLKFMVIISPTGLEERLKQMGKSMVVGASEPEPFKSGAALSGHGVKR